MGKNKKNLFSWKRKVKSKINVGIGIVVGAAITIPVVLLCGRLYTAQPEQTNSNSNQNAQVQTITNEDINKISTDNPNEIVVENTTEVTEGTEKDTVNPIVAHFEDQAAQQNNQSSESTNNQSNEGTDVQSSEKTDNQSNENTAPTTPTPKNSGASYAIGGGAVSDKNSTIIGGSFGASYDTGSSIYSGRLGVDQEIQHDKSKQNITSINAGINGEWQLNENNSLGAGLYGDLNIGNENGALGGTAGAELTHKVNFENGGNFTTGVFAEYNSQDGAKGGVTFTYGFGANGNTNLSKTSASDFRNKNYHIVDGTKHQDTPNPNPQPSTNPDINHDTNNTNGPNRPNEPELTK